MEKTGQNLNSVEEALGLNVGKSKTVLGKREDDGTMIVDEGAEVRFSMKGLD